MLQMDPMFKLFYLAQIAFWIQMVAVTVSAEKEKDFWQMIAHHFVAIGLTVTSYYMVPPQMTSLHSVCSCLCLYLPVCLCLCVSVSVSMCLCLPLSATVFGAVTTSGRDTPRLAI